MARPRSNRITPAPKETPKRKVEVTDAALAYLKVRREKVVNSFAIAQHPPSVKPNSSMAMDDAFTGGVGDWAYSSIQAGAYSEGLCFLGWPYLSELAQRPEYRKISETIATEMTRRWIKIQATGDKDKTDQIAALGEEMDRLKTRDRFRKGAELDGLFGGAHLFLDTGADDSELDKPIGNGRNDTTKMKLAKGSLKAIKVIEPIWVYPQGYDSTNPLSDDWYRPKSWLVMNKKVDASRLLTIVGREVPDIMKPAYSFRGISLSQLAKPYVDNWIRTRQSVSNLIYKFSTTAFKTDLAAALLANGGEGLFRRVALMTNFRDNEGTTILDKDEDFFNVATPLGTLDALQAQAQEQLASVSGIPLVKLLGITPSGLNASSDGEIRVFYDWIHARQEAMFGPALDVIFAMAQINIFGAVDPDLTYRFEPLWSLDEKELAEVNKIEADTDAVLVAEGIVTIVEARKRIAADPDTPYAGLDPDDVPEPPDAEGALGDPPGPDDPPKPELSLQSDK